MRFAKVEVPDSLGRLTTLRRLVIECADVRDGLEMGDLGLSDYDQAREGLNIITRKLGELTRLTELRIMHGNQLGYTLLNPENFATMSLKACVWGKGGDGGRFFFFFFVGGGGGGGQKE